jgi:outer membrane murein-binding lipoprotein Lpp
MTVARSLLAPFVVVVVTMIAGCGKNEEPQKLATPATTLNASHAAPEVKATLYAIDPAGKSTIDMPAPKEHIKAKTTAADGSLEVDATNLASTRGQVKIDLTTLTTSTFGDKDKDEAQTEHARTWLEAVVDGKVEEGNRWAVFAIRSIDHLSATDATKLAPTHEGADDVRSVTMTAHGDFLLHGHRAAKDVLLTARLHWPAGASTEATPPSLVEIRSTEPFQVLLAEHDVKPRDTFGKIAKGSLKLLGTKVAETAAIAIDLRAIRTSRS